MISVLIALAAALLASAAEADQAGSAWQLRDLGTLGGRESAATAINAHGQVVGRSQVEHGGRAPSHAFLWQDGKMTDLGTLGGRNSEAVDINDRGEVVGASDTARGARHAFVWQDGKLTDLGTLGGAPPNKLSGPATQAVAINDRGQVAGTSWTARGVRHAFLWQNGKMRDLGSLGRGPSVATAMNEHGDVVGWGQTRYAPHAFLWRSGRMIDLGTLGGSESEAEAINDHDQIAGWTSARSYDGGWFFWQDGAMRALPIRGMFGWPVAINARAEVLGNGPRGDGDHALLVRNGRTLDLGTLGGPESRAAAINDHGQVVGQSSTALPGRTHAFVWEGSRLIDLPTLGGRSSDATAISAGGSIAGWSLTRPRANNSSVRHAVIWEPSR